MQMNSSKKGSFQGAALRRQHRLLITFSCWLFMPLPICTCNYLFTPGSAQVLLIPFQGCSTYMFPRIESLQSSEFWYLSDNYLCSWGFIKENREGGGSQRDKRKRKCLTRHQRSWTYKSGNFSAFAASKCQWTQPPLTRYSHSRTCSTASRADCVIFYLRWLEIIYTARCSVVITRYSKWEWVWDHLPNVPKWNLPYSRRFLWKKADANRSLEVIEDWQDFLHLCFRSFWMRGTAWNEAEIHQTLKVEGLDHLPTT